MTNVPNQKALLTRVSTVLDRDRSNKPGMRTRTKVFLALRTMVPKKWHFTSFWLIKWLNLKLYYDLVIKIQVNSAIFYASWYILRKLDSSEMTLHIQSRVYQLSYIVNIRTGPGPVLSLFGLKDRRTGPFKKARTVDTLLLPRQDGWMSKI